MFRVNVGEENIYTFTVTDTDDFNVTVDDQPEDSILFDDGNGTYMFIWTPLTIPISELTFTAIDEIGGASVHSPLVQVCACFNGGQCTLQGVSTPDRQIQNLTCLCTEGKCKLTTFMLADLHFWTFSLFWRYLQ